MFERFTREARHVVARAQDHARRLRSPQIEPVHLLLALADPKRSTTDLLEGAGLDAARLTEALSHPGGEPHQDRQEPDQDRRDAEALRAIGVDLDRIRDSIEAAFGPGALRARDVRPRLRWTRLLPFAGRADSTQVGPGHLPFTPTAKKSLELALREAIRHQDNDIQAEHLVLGLLRCDDARLYRLLADLDVSGAGLRQTTEGRLRRSA